MAQKILIVEDEEVLLEVLEKKLENEGYDVLIAKDGEEGLKKFREGGPDLVLLDIIMPRMGGFEVMREIVKDPILAKIPIIVISNSGQPIEIEEATKLGAVDYLIKAEFSPEDVVKKIRQNLAPDKGHISGMNVSVKTPVIEEKETKKNLGGNSGGRGDSGGRILVIEDDRFLRDLIVQKLKKEGFVVLEAIDGEEGIKMTREHSTDLVLLDLILPGIDGFEVLKKMKEDSATKNIPVIILSNLGQKEDVERGLRLGAQDYLIKAHFTPGEIIEKVKSALK